MKCPNPVCKSRLQSLPAKLGVQRTNHPDTEAEWPKRFAGINGVLRRRVCEYCKHRVATIELTERELEIIVQRGYITRTTV
jgi:transcriptional regulator NrdR family protein